MIQDQRRRETAFRSCFLYFPGGGIGSPDKRRAVARKCIRTKPILHVPRLSRHNRNFHGSHLLASSSFASWMLSTP